MYLKNTAFRDGLVFEIDHNKVIGPGTPAVVIPTIQNGIAERFGLPKARATLSREVLYKVSQAVRGGTDEKLETLANRDRNGDVSAGESESEDE